MNNNLNCNIAIVGRPNVGKSRLFNRLVGRRRAVIDVLPGVTRDVITERVTYRDKQFKLIDTGGIGLEKSVHLSDIVYKKTLQAITQAQLIIFVCDIIDGVTVLDKEIAHILRKYSKKVILVVNKCDNKNRTLGVTEFYSLGLSTPICISAMHGIGTDDLLKEIYISLEKMMLGEINNITENFIKVSIIGRPNVGKSSFLNSILKEKRSIVDSIPGTTRDSIDTEIKYQKENFLLIDTAGIRHKSKISEKIVVYSIKRTEDSIKKSHVCLILIDGWEGLVKDDIRIINKAYEAGKACVIVVNKWDLVKKEITTHKYEKALINRMKNIQYMPVIFISAKKDINTLQTLDLSKTVYNNAHQWITTSKLNKFIKEICKNKIFFSGMNSKKLKIYYSTQVKTAPPCIKLFVNDPSYKTSLCNLFLERELRKHFHLQGVPLKFIYTSSHVRKNDKKHSL